MIRIGIEVSSRNLHCDLLENPGRYFFILESDRQASLCIQTCDSQGEDIRTHIIDCLSPNGEGDLYSIFEDCLDNAVLERQECKRQPHHEGRFAVTSQMVEMLSIMPDLMDWIISSILTGGRNLVIYPSECT